MFVHPLLKKKWFWISFISFLVFMFVFQTVIAFSIMSRSLSSGRWESELLSLGILYATLISAKQIVSLDLQRNIARITRLLWISSFVWAVYMYGLWTGLYFIGTITILSRFLGWGVKVMRRILMKKHLTSYS